MARPQIARTARERPARGDDSAKREARSQRYQAAPYVAGSSDLSAFLDEFEYDDDYALTSERKSGTFEE